MACAYSNADPEEVLQNIIRSFNVGARLTAHGIHIYHPTYFTHRVAKDYALPTNHEWWIKHNKAFIDPSEGILVACTKGWIDSCGIKQEVEYGRLIGKPVYYVREDGEDILITDTI